MRISVGYRQRALNRLGERSWNVDQPAQSKGSENDILLLNPRELLGFRVTDIFAERE
jgi:hypothetical protein